MMDAHWYFKRWDGISVREVLLGLVLVWERIPLRLCCLVTSKLRGLKSEALLFTYSRMLSVYLLPCVTSQ